MFAQAPTITIRPLSRIAEVGQSVTFAVAATGGAPLVYQWKRIGQIVAGATNATLTVASATLADGGWYQVVVSNASGTATSTFELNVSIPSTVVGWGLNVGGRTVTPFGLADAVMVAGGYGSTTALRANGEVVGWGADYLGPLVIPAGLTGVVGVSTRNRHVLAVKSDGTVISWGENYLGQTAVPAGLTAVIGVAAGWGHSLALRTNGTVVAWGFNAYGQTNVPTGLTGVVKVAAGNYHSVVLKENGTVETWGNAYTTVPLGLTEVIDIAGGNNFTLALKRDGTVVGWGYGEFHELKVPADLSNVVAIAVGEYHALALKSDGTVVAWGNNNNGAVTVPSGLASIVGIGAGSEHSLALAPPLPVIITGQPVSKSVTAGGTMTLSVTASGAQPAYQWFKNGLKLGNGGNISGAQTSTLIVSNVQSLDAGGYTVVVSNNLNILTSNAATLTVVMAPGGAPVLTAWPLSRRVLVGQPAAFTVATNDSGSHVYQWKQNSQVITGATSATLSFTNAETGHNGFYEVTVTNSGGRSTSSYFAFEVSLADGAPVGWGTVGANTSAMAPLGLRHVTAVAAGDGGLAALKTDGSLVVWGHNSSGGAASPTQLTDIIAIAAGGPVLGLRTNGTVAAWSAEGDAQSGLPLGLANIVRIFGSRSYSAAIRADGALITWNDNLYIADRPANLGPVVDLILGEWFAIALRPDGTLIGWGRGDQGELALPAGLNSVVALAGRDRKCFAVRANGTVVAWGSGAPSLPASLTNARSVASGGSHDFVLKSDGTLLQYGNLPAPAGLTDISQIAASVNAAVALIPARPPQIVAPPVAQQVPVGATATFTVTAQGAIPLTYQWQFNGRAITGATNSTLTVTDAQFAQTGQYAVVVSNAFGSVASNPVLLTGVNPAPTITNPPQSASVTAGQNLILAVSATGTSALTYQWRRDGTALPAATNATLNLGAAMLAMNGSYDVLIADGLSSTLSPSVSVQVAPDAYPQVVSVDPSVGAAFEVGGGSVSNFLRLAGGKILVVGGFSRVHGAPGRNIGRLNADGSGDTTFVPIAIDGPVYAAVLQSDGKILIGGSFRNVGGQPRAGVARLNANGSLDPTFTLTADFYGVFAIAIQPTGKIVLGGGFASRLARVNADGSSDAAFAPAPNSAVYALLGLPDGRIVVGGAFTQIAGQAHRGIAQLNGDGTVDTTFAGGAGFNDVVYALRLMGDRILAGGAFTSFKGIAASRIVRLFVDGAIDPGWSTGGGFNSSVYALEVRGDGKVLVAGAFGGFNGVAVTAVALLEANGSRDAGFRPGSFTQAAAAVSYLDNGSVLAGGAFVLVGNLQGIAVLTTTGAVNSTYTPGLMQPSAVRKIARFADGRIVAGGAFVYVNGVNAPYLARLNLDGSLDPTFTTNAIGRPNTAVDDMVVQPDGKLVIVGAFTVFKSTFISKIARIHPDGTIDAAFRPGDVINPTPDRVLLLPGGRLLVAAKSVPTVSGATPRRDALAAINSDGTLDSSFAAAPLPAGEIHGLAVQPDGKVVVGGSFRSFNGTSCNFIVRLLSNGARDSSFTAATDDIVRALALQPDGRILLAGDFLTVNDTKRARVARMQANGSLDATFDPLFDLNGSPTLLRLEPGGRMFVGGNFSSVTNHPVLSYLIRVSPTGALDSSFAAAGLAEPIADLALTENGALWLAGGELQINGVPRQGLLKTVSTSGPVILAQPGSRTAAAGSLVGLSVSVAGGQNVSYQWLKNGAAIPGATSPNLIFANSQVSDSGNYATRVTHGGGTLDSASATLTVQPSVPILASKLIAGFGGAIKNGSRWVLTAPALTGGSLPVSYQWTKNGTAVAGATARTLLIPSWQPMDAGSYQIRIENSVGSAISDPFVQWVTTTPDWDWRAPMPQGNSLFAMEYLNGRFVGGGARGTILRSTDGAAWSVSRLGVSNTISDFAYGNGTYVALSSFGGAWTSPDADVWTQRDTNLGRDGRYFSAITFGGGQFVAVGNSGLIATSTNGVSWTLLTPGITDSLGAIAFGGGKFVALGTGGRTYGSTDGSNWSAGAIIPRPVTSIAHGAGRFVAATANQVFSSSDGQAWSQKTLETTAAVTALQFTGAGFLATLDSTSGRYWQSTNGLDWTEQMTGLTLNAATMALTHGAGRYVMAGQAPETLVTSSSGGTWTRNTAPESLNYTAVAAGPGDLLAVGSRGATRLAAGGAVSVHPFFIADYDRPNDLTYGSNRYVAVFQAGSIWNSTDGTNWQGQTNSSHSYTGVSFANNRFFALGTNGVILTSPHGANSSWTTVNSGTMQTLFKTAFGASTYITVGTSGTVLSSSDGVTWTLRDSSGILSNINDVVFGAGKFVLVSEGGSIRTSANGITWAAQVNPLGVALKSLVFAAGKFFAFTTGNTNYLTSSDAITWIPAQNGNANPTVDAVEFNGSIYLVAANGAISVMPLGATAPVIIGPPLAQTVYASTPITFSVSVTGSGPIYYQWFKNGTAIVGATGASLHINSAAAADAGTYSVMITNAAGSVTSGSASLTVDLIPPGLLASQAQASVGAVALRGAFTVEGPASKQMLIRAVGPTLANFSVTGFLPDPTLTIAATATETEFFTNNDWEAAANAAEIASVAAQLGAYPLLGGSKDAAVLASFPPGTYRVIVGPVGDAGIASLEIYDASSAPRLVYVATRAQMGAAGSFAQGVSLLAAPAGRTYLIRALGPSMGLTSALADPELKIFSGETLLAANDNWGGSAALTTFANNVGAMPIPPASKDAALSFTPTASGAYTLQVAGVGGTSGTALLEVFESDAQRAATVPVAVVSLPNNLSGTAGQTAQFGVVAVGKPAPTFQWSRNASPIAGAVSSTFVIPSAQVGDAGTYSVRVSNGGTSAYTASASLAITAANNATHGIIGRGYVAGSIVILTTTLHFVGAPAALNWNVDLPANWSFASDTSTANNKPTAGATGTLAWAWTTPPASPLTFTYTLNVPTGETAARSLTPTFLVGGVAALIVPATLTVGPKPPFHSADTDGDYALSLFELTRVIELYNTRNGTVRTGAYRVDASNLEDGFSADSNRVTAPASALVQYHSADTRGATTGTPRDGMIDLFELTRVIELYNTRTGTVRTGRYHVQEGTEDGFGAGP